MPAPKTVAGPPADQKLACLEAIRGLAALSVLLGHFLIGFWPGISFRAGPEWDRLPAVGKLLMRFPGKYLLNGETAVAVFFVLSGFVLSLRYFQTGSVPALGTAAVRRYPRLMLPAGASILLACALMQADWMCNQAAVRFMDDRQGTATGNGATTGNGAATGNGATHAWLAAYYNFAPSFPTALREAVWNSFVHVSRYNLVTWTMPIELTGSFFVFGFLALFGGLRNRWLLYAACGGLMGLNANYFLLEFLLGMVLCDVWVRHRRSSQRRLASVPALGLLGLGLFLVPWKPLAALLVVAAVTFAPRLQQLLEARLPALLGRISFMLYLVHMPVFCSLGCGLYLFLCRDHGWSHDAAAATAAAAALAASLLAAWILCRIVDHPTLALTRRLESLFRPNADGATTVTTMATATTTTAMPRSRAA